MTRIFQTRRWPDTAEQALDGLGDVKRRTDDRPLSARELRAGLASADVFCPTVSDTIDALVLGDLDLSGKLIANFGAGTSHIDVAAARAAGAVISNTPDVLTDCTADVAMLLILAVARRVGEGERQLRAGAWPGWHPIHMMGKQVSGSVLGLVGFGRIAQAIAQRAAKGFGMEILVWNRSPVASDLLAACAARQVGTLDELLARADFVSLNIPGGQQTHHLIDAGRLQKMKPTAFLINAARGSVVDEAALVQALDQGVIAGAGLDVFEEEPRVHPGLLQRENVVLLPHLGSATMETRVAMGLRVAENIRHWQAGEPLRDPVA